MSEDVGRAHRFRRSHPCPVCKGGEDTPRGQGKRCTGYLSTDGDYIHCSRPEMAGPIAPSGGGTAEETFGHRRWGSCHCGVQHGPAKDRAPRRSDGIEATYDYVDEHGDVLYQVVRKVGKKFVQRRPKDGAIAPYGANDWEWSLGKVRRVLYRLPELLGADASQDVFIVEGEKDVDTLRRHGLVATCNPHGAGKWRSVSKDACGWLKGRSVVVIPDADDPGRKHAEDVRKSLAPHARVVVVELPGAKDSAAWLSAGGTTENLAALVAEARERADVKGEPVAVAVEGEWARGLLHKKRDDGSDGGTLRPISANVVTILTHAPEWAGVIAYDEFAECVVTRKPPRWRAQDAPRDCKPGEWTALDTARLQNWLADRWALDLGHEATIAAVQLVADRARVHPVREWLNSIQWDGVRRTQSWLADVFGADDTPLTRAIGSAWLVSAVARIMRPGCQVDTVLVLEGEPGIFKSSVLRELVGDEWFFEMSITDVTKLDAMQVLRCKWVAEFPEIDGLSRTEQAHVKAYFSRRIDRYRESYGRRAGDFPRQVVFAASTNKDQWIVDETGGTGRRMWPLLCRRGDVALARAMRTQLWAEAVVRYRDGDAWHMLDPELRDAERDEQDERYRADPWEQRIGAWLQEKPSDARFKSKADMGVTSLDVLRGAIGAEISKIAHADANRIAACLHHLGWVQGKREMRDSARVRPYYPVPSEDAEHVNGASLLSLDHPDLEDSIPPEAWDTVQE